MFGIFDPLRSDFEYMSTNLSQHTDRSCKNYNIAMKHISLKINSVQPKAGVNIANNISDTGVATKK